MITILLIIITVIISVAAFYNPSLLEKLQFNASRVYHKKELYRLFTHGFVHANWEHLIVNMIVLYSFGRALEYYFHDAFGAKADIDFLILYFGGMLISNAQALIKHRNNYYYNAVGASGAVSAVLFAAIFFNPWEKIYFFAILPMPGIVFAVLYLIYSYSMSRKETGHVAHDAHFLGAIFGFVFPILLNSHLLNHFFNQLFSIL